MSGIAEVLHNLGYGVSGSDSRASETTRRLGALGLAVTIGHRAENVGTADVVVRSSAVAARQPGDRGRAPAPRPRDPARRDAGRTDAHEVRGGRGRHARQDHHHLPGGHGAGPRRARSDHGDRRAPERPGLQRQAGARRLPGGRGGRERRLVPEAQPHHRRGHHHRRRAPGLLPGPGPYPGRLRAVHQQGPVLRPGRAVSGPGEHPGHPAAGGEAVRHLRPQDAGGLSGPGDHLRRDDVGVPGVVEGETARAALRSRFRVCTTSTTPWPPSPWAWISISRSR